MAFFTAVGLRYLDNPADVALSCCSSLSITMRKKVSESTDPCCTPRVTAKGAERVEPDFTTAVRLL